MEKLRVEILSQKNITDVFKIQKAFFDVKDSSSIVSSFSSDTLNYFVLFLGEKIIGYLECSLVLDESEIFEIAINGDFQGRGYSKLLMDFYLHFCKKNNVRTIFLEVNTINTKAISLYKNYGFVAYSIRKKYYGDNDAILMKLELN